MSGDARERSEKCSEPVRSGYTYPVLVLTASPKLGARAKQALDEGAQGQAVIYVPVIVLAELLFLNEKAGRPLDFAVEYKRLRESEQFVFVALFPEEILDLTRDVAVPEMHDRMITGVARRLGVTCLSCDSAITGSGLVSTCGELPGRPSIWSLKGS